MFALPVRTRALVAWPMLYGAAAVALLWVAAACLVYRPSGFRTPVLLPALGFAAGMAWLQALSWSPVANPALRVASTLVLVTSLVALPAWVGATGRAPGPAVAALLAAYLPAAYAVAVAGVASDRRGDAWRVLPRPARPAPAAARPARRRRPFRSAAEAQLWYEWGCHGLVVPMLVAPLPLFMLVATLTAPWERPDPRFFPVQLGLLLSLPTALAGSQGMTIARLSPFWVRSRGFMTFLAMRPMTSAALAAAKFRMAARSVLLTYALHLAAIALWVVAGGHAGDAADLWRTFLGRYPGWRAAAVLALGVVTVPALTWGWLTASFPVTLTGRRRFAEALTMAGVAGFSGLIAAAAWLAYHPAWLARLMVVVPWVVGAVAALKAVVAAWAFRACLRRGLMGPPAVLGTLAASLAFAACSVTLAALLLPSEGLPVARPAILLGVATFTPLARFALAPLALDWNRHR
jgi:hypothetical protein